MDSPRGFETASKTDCQDYVTFNTVLLVVSVQCPGTLTVTQTSLPQAWEITEVDGCCPSFNCVVKQSFFDVINIRAASKEHKAILL